MGGDDLRWSRAEKSEAGRKELEGLGAVGRALSGGGGRGLTIPSG